MKSIICPLSLLLLIAAALHAASPGNLTVTLPHGVCLEISDSWVLLDGEKRLALNGRASRFVDLAGAKLADSTLPFAANLEDTNGRTISMVNVRFYTDNDITQEDVRGFTESDLSDIDREIKQSILGHVAKGGIIVTDWAGTRKATIDHLETLITQYDRIAHKGPGTFRVRLVRVWTREVHFTLTVSYLVSEAPVLQPITDAIIASLRVQGALDDARSSSPSSSTARPREKDYTRLFSRIFAAGLVGVACVILRARDRKRARKTATKPPSLPPPLR